MIERLPIRFKADANKVLLRHLDLSMDRLNDLINQVEKMSDQKMEMIWAETRSLFEHRHRNYLTLLDQHTRLVEEKLGKGLGFLGNRRSLLGAYVTKEYSIQAAALFNPSIVMHPDQPELSNGVQRFVMSLRATGEGHISSLVFKEGFVEEEGNIVFGSDTIWQTAGEIGISSDPMEHTDDHYEVSFSSDIPINERVIFPYAQSESMGMEDVRMVRFVDGDRATYLGTYTAYDGKNIRSKILQTDDFLKFKIRNLRGSAIKGKGMALFPRKIRGHYAAIGRQDGVAMTLMYSDHFLTWDKVMPLQDPVEPFEFIQVGNCGSPIETAEGWLLLTHSVGPMRRYTIGVSLLDLDHPEKMLGKLQVPLMQPDISEREGYVPNVLYTCGWLKHGKEIILPYAMSDAACGFAKLNIQDVLTELTSS